MDEDDDDDDGDDDGDPSTPTEAGGDERGTVVPPLDGGLGDDDDDDDDDDGDDDGDPSTPTEAGGDERGTVVPPLDGGLGDDDDDDDGETGAASRVDPLGPMVTLPGRSRDVTRGVAGDSLSSSEDEESPKSMRSHLE
jgi:hypothetical protein